MEPVTHALTSIALGRAGLNKVSRMATPVLVVSGLAADLDWITRLAGARAFLRGHRTATHSLAGTALLIAVATLAFYFAGKKYPKMAIGLTQALILCSVGAGVHLLLDLLNGYGVKLFWPLGMKWYAWDLSDTVDAWIIFFLLVGLLLPELFRLVLEEIGSKPNRRGRQRGAVIGLALVLLFVAGRAFAHQRAMVLLESREYRSQPPLNVAAFPHPAAPLVWSGVVETDNAVVNLEVPLSPGARFDPDAAVVRFKPEATLGLKNAAASEVGKEFLSYARFPLANIEPEADGFVVRLRDMRFAGELAGRRGILAIIDLNAQNQVTGGHFEFDDPSKP